ncbi:MAG: hypothetical protein Q4F84_05890 [Fibrobacter sp.]|nr:hypothetical protein [Fibrobacter sp.]
MDKNLIVIGGWGIKPEILCVIFGKNAHYLDSNTIMTKLIDKNESLKPDWKDIAQKEWNVLLNKPFMVAGWSTGAIIASAIANQINPDYLVLFSPTLSFCRKENYRFGMRSSVLQSMIKMLQTDKQTVMNNFLKSCGIDGIFENKYSQMELIAGLQFLEQADLRLQKEFNTNAIAIHGTHDSVIPLSAGKLFSEQLKCPFFEINDSHAFFCSQTNAENIKKIIRKTFNIDIF